ncbi:MAG TPA: decaprenyl-phosphate phosphoribosyltransferase [Nitrospiraceae bacterium]|nr:decaprenyl-phosphate phosphoribosyltransferase [Nitrospiraceae bacterium]
MKLVSYIALLRPHQWLKNLLLLFPPFFGGKMVEPDVLANVLPALLSFSFVASCSYIINDINDIEADRNHGVKRNRLIARGDIPVPFALVIAFLLFAAAFLISFTISPWFSGLLGVYLLISLSYTFFVKNKVILDIFFIAFGFLIRVLAGGEAFTIPVTSWLFLTVFMVSLLLAAGKRLGELVTLGDEAHRHRKSLTLYTDSFLRGILWFSASSALVTYALYTLEHRSELFYTVPVAAFGLLRYIYIVKDGKGDPTDALIRDGQIMGVGILWVLMIGAIIYMP